MRWLRTHKRTLLLLSAWTNNQTSEIVFWKCHRVLWIFGRRRVLADYRMLLVQIFDARKVKSSIFVAARGSRFGSFSSFRLEATSGFCRCNFRLFDLFRIFRSQRKPSARCFKVFLVGLRCLEVFIPWERTGFFERLSDNLRSHWMINKVAV